MYDYKTKRAFFPLPDIFPSEKPQNNTGIFLFLNYSTVLNLILIPSCALDIALLALHACFVIKNVLCLLVFQLLCSDLIRVQSGVLWHLLAFIKVWKWNKSCSIFPASGCMEHFFPLWNSNVTPKSFHRICCNCRTDKAAPLLSSTLSKYYLLQTGAVKTVWWGEETTSRGFKGPLMLPSCAQSLPSSILSTMPLRNTSSPKQPNEILIQLGTVHVSKRPFSHRLALFSLDRHDIRLSLIALLYAPAHK